MQGFQERLLLDVSIDEDLVLRARAKSTIAGKFDSLELFNLEFGLNVGPSTLNSGATESDENSESQTGASPSGAIQLRSNIATRSNDLSVIPGEILYKSDPLYFSMGDRKPPPQQDFEKVMYQACSACLKVYCECAERRAKMAAAS